MKEKPNEKGLPAGRQAVVLLSGGLDSSTTLFLAKEEGYKCHCLVFDYGQRHKKEVKAARRIAHIANCKSQVVKIKLPWKGSSLLDRNIKLPTTNYKLPAFIPNTYVPARNIIFLSFALSYAEAIRAQKIFIGANAIDYSGYPDCRPEFYKAFNAASGKGTKVGAEGKAIKIETPLIYKTKAQIVRLAVKLGVPLDLTWSCYKGGAKPCGVCDSCRLRAKGFKEANVTFHTMYDL